MNRSTTQRKKRLLPWPIFFDIILQMECNEDGVAVVETAFFVTQNYT